MKYLAQDNVVWHILLFPKMPYNEREMRWPSIHGSTTLKCLLSIITSQNILNCQMISYLNVNNHLSSLDRLLVIPRASPKFNLLLMVLLPIPPLPFLIIAANSPKSICPSCDTKHPLVQSWKPRKQIQLFIYLKS